uniref:Small ribosomal subunit protein uS7m n=1 Tax=Plectus sambesii TaxID=2011161 RepID=A0A914WKB3_9BILA
MRLRSLVTLGRMIAAPSSARALSVSQPLRTVYDPKAFEEPITDKKLLIQPLEESDPRNFLLIKAMQSDDTPVFYRDRVVDKFVNLCLQRGYKEIARTMVYEALETIKRHQYKAWRKAPTAAEKSAIELNPFVVFSQSIKNCQPMMKLIKLTRGGIVYQVPAPVAPSQAEFMAMKSLRDICREKAHKGRTSFETALAGEILSAYKNEGATIQAKQEFHKQCEANRAFAHYRTMAS